MSNPTLRIHTHWQVAQSHPANQNLPKSMAAPTHGRQESAAKLIDKIDKNKNGQLLTSGHKKLGIKWLIERSASHQGSVSGDTFAAPKSPTFHTAKR
jgi:hypothetical protein